MSIPQRPWTPPEASEPVGIGRDFVFEETMARDPDELNTREYCQVLLAPVLEKLGQGDLQAALGACERLRRQRPDDVFSTVEHARLLLAGGDPKAGLALLRTALHKNERHLEALKLSGFARLQQGEFLQAMELFGMAARRCPADSFSQINFRAMRNKLRRSGAPAPQGVSQRPLAATSIPPKGLDVSRQAVASWLERGFRVLSVNTPDERDVLAPHFPEVEFCLCEETGKERFGKDYQYLDTLLDALARVESPLCAIINADIVLRGEAEAWDQLCAAAQSAFVYGSRVNVQRLEDRHGALLEPGFDYFLFPSSMLSRIPRNGFLIGQPAWDVFLPAWIARCGLPLRFCYSPAALHVNHAVNWSRTNNSRFLVMALSWFAPDFARMLAADPGCHAYLRPATAGIFQMLHRVPKGMATPLFCASPLMDACFAPVDPYYWARKTEETLVVLEQGDR